MTPTKIFILRKADGEHSHHEAYTSKKRLYNRLNELCHYSLISYEAFTRKLSGLDFEYPVRFFLPTIYRDEYPYTVRMLVVNTENKGF